MPNQLTSTGLQTATQAELIANLTAAYQSIYGADINLDSDTPDGQMMNIFIQSVLDLEDLLVQIYNSFDPDLAFGTTLDQRVAINGIQRQGGTFTITNLTIVTSQAITLYGLNQTTNPVYTVADDAGNNWELINTQTPGSAGTYVYSFQAENPGAVLTVVDTIINPVTVVLGVVSVNNPNTFSVLGTNEESDFALRIRRQQSVSLPSQGYLSGLLASLENVPGVTFAYVHENNTGSTDAFSVPGHSIWVIVTGSFANVAVATAIYNQRNAGCGMYNISGNPNYEITQVDGSSFPIFWDSVTTVPLFIKFTALSINNLIGSGTSTPPNISAILAQLSGLFAPGVNQEVNINQLATYVQQIDPNTLVTSAGFSLLANGSYTSTLTPANLNKQFIVSSTDIIILPMIMFATGIGYVYSGGAVASTTASVAHGGNTIHFSALGGNAPYTFSKTSGAGSINSSTGLYTSSSAGTDVMAVTDALSNTTFCTITVT